MNIFVLEDDPMRLRWFRQRFIGHTLTCAESCAQVDRFQPPYDLVLLDHDLGGRVYQDHVDCGETFARLIKDTIGDAAIIIHSYNAPGATRIKAELPRGHRLPFRGSMFNNAIDRLLRDGISSYEVA